MVLFICTTINCGSSSNSRQPQTASSFSLRDSFDDPLQASSHWSASLDSAPSATVQIKHIAGNGVMLLSVPSESEAQDISISRVLKIAPLRGDRIRVSVRLRAAAAAAAVIRFRLSIPSLAGNADAQLTENVVTPSTTWTSSNLVLDVPSDASSGTIELSLRGAGAILVDDLEVTSLGRSPSPVSIALSSQTIQRLEILAHAIALIRYFHPSDQSAELDWNEFSIWAVDRVLREQDKSMSELLSTLFAEAAPTVRFKTPSVSHRHNSQLLPKPASATHLTRWYRLGLGSEDMYCNFRIGLRDKDCAFAYYYTTVSLPAGTNCQQPEFTTQLYRTSGEVSALVKFGRGQDETEVYDVPFAAGTDARAVTSRTTAPSGTKSIRIGLALLGQSEVEFSRLSLRCENGYEISTNESTNWKLSGSDTLFKHETTPCGRQRCIAVRRAPSSSELLDSDFVELELGDRTRVWMPTAVWTDGQRTFPTSPSLELPLPTHAAIDLPTRLAAVITTWSTLLWFYPYFDDRGAAWAATFPRAISEVAAARNSTQVHTALSRLVAELHDGHGLVTHPTRPRTGAFPLAFRRLENKFVVVGGIPQYVTPALLGAELLQVEDADIERLYTSQYALTSGATNGGRDFATLHYLASGQKGAMKRVTLKDSSGEFHLALPLISREVYGSQVRPKRPTSGTELADGVYYVDGVALSRTALEDLISSLKRARVVIWDQRGHVGGVAQRLLAHFIRTDIPSPVFRVSIASPSGPVGYGDNGWSLWPAEPALNAQLVVLIDGRAVSAAETVLQMIRDNKLATFVGEPTGGTNGDVITFGVPGGYSVRFTGMHVSAANGTIIHGRGIVPDRLVRPTLAGVRSGRDEILEAGLEEARRLIAN